MRWNPSARGWQHELLENKASSHPGALLREVVLPAMWVSISQAARDMKVSRHRLHKILAAERAITAEMATRLGKYCGNGPELWLSMQSAHDLWQAQRSLADELAEIPTRAAGWEARYE